MQYRGLRTAIGIVAVTTAVAALPVVLQPPVATAAPGPCAPVAIIPVRGSGEGKEPEKENEWSAPSVTTTANGVNYSGVDSSGYEGERLVRLLGQFYQDYPAHRNVPIIDVGADYPAVPVGKIKESTTLFIDDSPVYRSSQDGVTAGLKAIGDYRWRGVQPCPDTKFIMLGYSQGAMVARDVSMMLPNVISSNLFFGDPWQKSNADGTTGTGSGGTGFFRWNYPGVGKAKDSYYDYAFKRRALCHKHDVICDFGLVSGIATGTGPNHDYFKPSAYPGEASSEAAALAAEVERLTGVTVPNPGPGRLDVSFVVDTTGSMGPYIEDVKADVETIADELLSRGNGSTASLVEYRDHGDAYVSRIVVPATGDASNFETGIRSLFASGGGDYPEAVYSGMIDGVRSLPSPSGGRRVMIVLGDAPAHDPEPVTGYTGSLVKSILLGEAVAPPPSSATATLAATSAATDRSQTPLTGPPSTAAKSVVINAAELAEAPTSAPASPDAITLYTLSAWEGLDAQLGPMSEATGGQLFDITNSSSVSDSVLEALDAASKPVPVLTVSNPIIAGAPAFLSGLASSGQGSLIIEFDTDGDGSYETSAPDGFATKTFSAAGEATVGMRVTDSAGRTSTTTRTIQVLDRSVASAFDPNDTSTKLEVSLEPTTVAPRGTIRLSFAAPASAESFLVGIAGHDDPWNSDPLQQGDMQKVVVGGTTTAELTLDPSIAPGTYWVLVRTDSGHHGMVELTVRNSAGIPLGSSFGS